ncbi:MAG: hypothetical protein ACW986_06820 [Promethearchaeota archaeon]|jgi:hypothetical protein
MDPKEEKRIVDDILNKRRLSYSIEILDVQGDKYTIRNNFGSTITYTKKDDKYLLDSELN